jgi:hypothetical protein
VAGGLLAPANCAAQGAAKQADAFVRENNTKRAQNPEGVSFTVRFKDNQKQFHQGEVMRLELSFASAKPHTFIVDTGTYDRSGRLESDKFVLDQPEAVVDPLYDYFNSNFLAFIAGGIRGIPELTEKPEIINADLNEWMRFDKPGLYRLYVVSGRLGRKDVPPKPSPPVVSNVVEFEVLPLDEKWANEQFNQAVTALSKGDGDTRSYCRILRFVGTTSAVTEMIKRSRGEPHGCDYEYKFGLIGSAHRDFVIQELEKSLSAPEQPIGSTLIGTLALLDFARQTTQLPPYPEGNEEQIRQWQSRVERRRTLYNERLLNYLRQLLAAIPQKDERARATSIQTLLEYRSELVTNDWSTVGSYMPEVFSRLPVESQTRLLTSEWKPLANAAMLPVLREILKRPEDKNNDHHQKYLRTTALRRLYELTPEEGRRVILDEIRRPSPRVYDTVLRSLPDAILPELDSVLIENLEQTRRPNGNGNLDAIASLITRYASDGIAPQVRAVYEAPGPGKWACSIQASLIAYFLRVDPPTGGDYLKQALAAREKNLSRCYTSTLLDVARLQAPPEVEEIAIASLDDEDTEVVTHAALVLKEFGSVDAEKAIWRRFEKWHEAMQSRSEELRKQNAGVPAFGAPQLSGQVMIEQQLRDAIVYGQLWLADPEKLKRVRQLCFTDNSREEIDHFIEFWNRDINLFLNADGEPVSISIAQYHPSSIDLLKQRLVQFPSGTVFKWRAVAGNNEAKAQEIFQQIKAYLEDHGMKVEADVANKVFQ